MITRLKDSISSEKGLTAAILFAVVFVIMICAIFSYGFAYMYGFRTFKSSVQKSMADAKKGIGIEITYDGEERVYSEQEWKKFSEIVRTMKVGKKQTEFPGDETGEILTISFNDGTKLEFCEATIPEETRMRENGVCIRYTYADGKQYIFNTDQFGFAEVQYLFT